MKISRGVVLASLMAFAATPVFAAFSLSDAANAVSSMQGGDKNAAAPANGLLSSLGSQLNVTPEQAIGGTGAMLGLAKNKLSGNDYSQLSQSVPGLDQLSGGGALAGLGGLLGGQSGSSSAVGNALGNVKDTGDLNNAFGALGMNSSMVGQFAPIILKYLGDQGVGGPLLQSLSGIWGAGS
ncbi:DUF2780 domain-containing protein [Pseudomonas gingeri]|uniref:DUF2780 domain-containing protein n=1 Tax=Pseudomonas gingeri TaxID=117681 RepID=A0A7Y7Y7C3_9PSED|nr:DUF2780 domain-containing protein [Pseudomonas gingeri]NWA01942.1 DUF2780 domain-containing protein [Pseudomonas gingeri]NWA17950.1 DUF2780 domain-containing protein [Pseudomonas gingeri]NWA53395.1 DUF2780 domain-containing protein [Pseudomonas gingeri]NWA95292.1 DUF2780 domain-containing protein [Pseudomonas gingeri]NWB00260.1 DUF2780 domain-containing protein [Pseudomonas gingeri]